MDYLREDNSNRSKKKKLIASVVALCGFAVFIMFNINSALPLVEKETVYIDSVKRGDMVRQVSGTGSLVSIDNRLVPAISKARVERILAQPGTLVQPDSLLMQLSNPMVSQQYDESKLKLSLAKAQLNALKEKHHNKLLNHKAKVVSVRAKYEAAKLQMESEGKLIKSNIVSKLNYKKSQLEEAQLNEQLKIEVERLERLPYLNQSEILAKEAELALLERQLKLQKELMDALYVKAGIDGIVQEIRVEEGQGVPQGQILALVSRQDRLKAEIRVVESQAREVMIGQTVKVTTGNSTMIGQVSRIDPSVLKGTVTVDVAFTGNLPDGARPNLRVNGIIEIERLEDVLYINKPVKGNISGNVELYQIDNIGVATLTSVRLGRASISTVEIISGLREGNQIVLSDTSSWPDSQKIRLN